MTIEERKNRILAAIAQMQAEGQDIAKNLAELDEAYREGVNSV